MTVYSSSRSQIKLEKGQSLSQHDILLGVKQFDEYQCYVFRVYVDCNEIKEKDDERRLEL